MSHGVLKRIAIAAALCLPLLNDGQARESVQLRIENSLDLPRPGEIVSVPWPTLAAAIPNVGAGWEQSGDFPNVGAWDDYLKAFARRTRSPLQVSVVPE